MAIELENADIECFHQHRLLIWTACSRKIREKPKWVSLFVYILTCSWKDQRLPRTARGHQNGALWPEMGRLTCGLSHEWSSREKPGPSGALTSPQWSTERKWAGKRRWACHGSEGQRTRPWAVRCWATSKLWERSLLLSTIYAYLTCLIKESPVPFSSQIQIPNSS